MKARRFLFRAPTIFGTPLKYGAPVFIGFTVIISGLTDAHGGDILRGGSASARPKPGRGTAAAADTPDATDAARANARDTLARTTRTLEAMRAMQNAARNAALANRTNHLGKNPNNLTVNLPKVPNGLGLGALNPTTDPTKWTGANTPVQTVKNGKTTVTIKQTTQQALLEWQTLNVGKKTTLTFDQSKGGADSSKWIAFNRITDPSGNPTQILGNIKADGQIYLINTNGIIFGGGSQVNARGLTASSLPINTNLIERGLLNNPDAQFLFSGLAIPAGTNGTPAFTPDAPINASGGYGDVIVQEGAILKSPTNSAKTGGRVALVGANVTNNGTILTPDGQTILASGLQVGFNAHNTSDASLRGLDVYVGSVGTYAGTTTNRGIIESDRGNITIGGKTVDQAGALSSTTSVSLNGRIDIQAQYDAVSISQKGTFLFQKTGTVDLGSESMIRVIPELDSKETTIGTELALQSQINVTGKAVRFGEDSILLATGGQIGVDAGTYNYVPLGANSSSSFVQAGGQLYIEKGTLIDVAGLKDVSVPVSQNIIEVQLRGAELANSPLQRLGNLRNATVFVDIRDAGTYQSAQWIGTPLADISGFANLIQKSIGQFMVAGGEVNIRSGGSVVMQAGSRIDVSGGSIKYREGTVKTTMLVSNGHLVDIRDARPDEVYTGILNDVSTVSNPKFGVFKTYHNSLTPSGGRFEAASIQGAAGGGLSISAPSMALDGRLIGRTITGDRQTDSPPTVSTLKRSFVAQDLSYSDVPFYSPTPPKIIFKSTYDQQAAAPFQLDSNGNPLALSSERLGSVYLSPELLASNGFGSLTVENDGGDIIVPTEVALSAPVKGNITLTGANITIDGSVTAAGGKLAFNTNNVSLDFINSRPTGLPEAAKDRGLFILGAKGVISTAGLVVDNRLDSPGAGTTPLVINGGEIKIASYSSTLTEGGLIDVSGGAAASPQGKISYGAGGSLTVLAGQDQNYKAVLGGTLGLGATLKGQSGGKAGSLSLVSGAFQIGGTTGNNLVTLIQPEFFSKGGFGSFSLTGIGLETNTPDDYVPGLLIAEGTRIRPVVYSMFATLKDGGGLQLSLKSRSEGDRTPVSLTFGASGATNTFTNQLAVRGDLVMEKGSVIQTDAKGSVSLKGQTNTILGSVISPGGTISISGSNRYPSNEANPTSALVTTHLGSTAFLSTAGKTLLVDSTLGLREGEVLKGGNISISGNIAAEKGAILDVSGSKGVLDLVREASSLSPSIIVAQGAEQYVPVTIQSDAGNIVLSGGQMLHSDATLIGRAGGKSATGGSITVSSGRFIPVGTAFTSADVNLVVRQEGLGLSSEQSVGTVARGADGVALQGIGGFAVDSFSRGGFDSLELNGNVRFDGPVSINIADRLKVADGGVLYANDNVRLSAAYVALGQAFRAPTLVTDSINRFTSTDAVGNITDFYTFAPTWGTGHLTVTADLIDIGDLSLQGIGSADFFAKSGDIRGNGTLSASGDLFFKAGQIYTTTKGRFGILAYDYNSGGIKKGSVTIRGGNERPLPLSAGGSLSIYASDISQGGTLRAPIGTINLGWSGTGTSPVDTIAGNTLSRPVTSTLTLESGSTTSVSAIDPKTGKGVRLPYGISFDGKSWIDPSGLDITVSGAPSKAINLSATTVVSERKSTVDIRGGGNLYAYRWVSGNGGRNDILASTSSFAVVPSYGFDYAPYAPFNSNSSAVGLNGNPGYANETLRPGDKITLGASSGLPPGTYTLLPARYALLPGAFLVTPQSGNPVGTVARPDGSTIVSGYRSNNLDPNRKGRTTIGRFEIAPATVVRERSQYDNFLANNVLRDAAITREFLVPRLPIDSGYLSFSATAGMTLAGAVDSAAPDKGRGSVIDISSPGNILINKSGKGGVSGTLTLSAAVLNSFGAETLLIGGIRSFGTGGATVDTATDNITLDNAGTALVGSDIILTAKEDLVLASGASITATGGNEDTDDIILGNSATLGSGDGTLVRVSGTRTATVIRNGVGTSTGPSLTIGKNAKLTGGSVILDSTFATSLSPSAKLNAKALALSSGQISIQLSKPGALNPTTGLVLSGTALESLQSSAESLALRSYSTLDVYGTGTVGSNSFQQLTLDARAIRTVNLRGGTATFAAKNLVLENSSSPTALTLSGAPLDGSLLFDAQEISLGRNSLLIGNAADVSLIADSRIFATGDGSLNVIGNLSMVTPLVTADAAADHTIVAGANLAISRPDGKVKTGATGGLGAKLTLEGRIVKVNSDVLLPSGTLTLTATHGDILIGNLAQTSLSAAGTTKTFVDAIRYTGGGAVNLNSTNGSVVVGPNALITVAAPSGGGDAGQLNIKTPEGTFDLDSKGKIIGIAKTSSRKGSFSLDALSISSSGLATIDSTLNKGSFTESRKYRIRTGDVTVEGLAEAHEYAVSADNGDITVGGQIDASGKTGGTIQLQSSGSVILDGGSKLTVMGDKFSSSGKGGAIILEAGSQKNGSINTAATLDIQTGATLDLSVSEYVAGSATTPGSSAFKGQFTGTLHLRAPRSLTNDDLQISAITGAITGASSILAEGYKLYDLTDYGGTISTDVQNWIKADANAFLGEAGVASASYTAITSRLLANNSRLSSAFVLAAGVEIINTAAVANTSLNLGAVGSTIAVPVGGSVIFPNGTPGNNLVRSTVAATIVSATGASSPLAASTPVSIPAGSSLVFSGTGGTVSYASGTGGVIAVSLVSGSSYTTGTTNSNATVSNRGSVITLNTAGTSSIALSAGSIVTLPVGTVGTNKIRSTVAGTITSRNGTVTILTANSPTAVEAGSYIRLDSAGGLSFASGGTGGAIQVGLASGSFTTAGATSVIPASGDLTLGTLTSTATSDWNLEAFRFGAKSAPGVLTLKAAGNLVFYNALSDGFAEGGTKTTTSLWLAPLMAQNTQTQNPLPINTQSWTYRLTSGADFSSADFETTRGLDTLAPNKGSLLLGKNYGRASTFVAGTNALTATALADRFQVIRTGSGDITVNAGRNVYLLNQFATIYSAGTRVADATSLFGTGDFSVPFLTASSTAQLSGTILGSLQQNYPAQYSMAGGDVSINAGVDIARMTRTVATGIGGVLIPDSSRQLPTNWLYRRGHVNPVTGEFGSGGLVAGGSSFVDPSVSTTWWVDFSNFFEGIGALGGGDVSLEAGRNVQNIDAATPTNARIPKGKPDTSKLVELGGGNISVFSGKNIDGGVYYVERGLGTLSADGSITTNSTRSPSLGIISSLTAPDVLHPDTWLPTTLFLGKGGFNVQAAGDLLIGPTANPFLLPAGIGDKFWYKTYFNTYSPDSFVNVTSLGGSITHRTEVTIITEQKAKPLLQAWMQTQQLFRPTSASNTQPWLRLNETEVVPFSTALGLMAPVLHSTSFSGDINLAGDITLFPSAHGQIELISAGSINGLQPSGLYTPTGSNSIVRGYVTSSVNLSDADPDSIPRATTPYSYQALVGLTFQALNTTGSGRGTGFLDFIDAKFAETGSITGAAGVLQTKQALHDQSLLHLGDADPVKLYALGGDISGLNLYSPKATRVIAGNDVTDIALYLQNLSSSDFSIVSAGRDLTAYNANTSTRVTANSTGNFIQAGQGPTAGDIQICGPGTLQVIAGRNIDLGTGTANDDGTGVGITSIGNSRNPALSNKGADLIVSAGTGPANSLARSNLKWAAFIKDFVSTPEGLKLVEEIDPDVDFAALTPEEQAEVALQVFYLVLRDAGRDHTHPKNEADVKYANGYTAIESLFGKGPWDGEILTQGRDIRTRSGGDISILAPGGGLTLANTTIGNPLTPPGIVTESGGKINIFTDQNVDIGIGRIFTLRGGDQVIWSTNGDIAAGSSSRTVSAAPPTRVIIDPQSGAVQTDLAGLATGGGIGALASVKGVKPANIDLIAPTGQIDAGDAGISATGNINVAAVTIVNAANISSGGTSSGTPSAPSAPSVSAVTSASNTSAAATSTAAAPEKTQPAPETNPAADTLSLITVEVIGYGDGGADDEEDKDKEKKAAEGDAAQ